MVNRLSSATARLWTAPNDPGVSEPNVEQGNYFLNTSSGELFYCQTPTAGLQAWNKIAIPSSASPLSPTLGGTGLTDPTVHSLMVASGSSAFNLVSVGATGTVLVGSTGADPSFSATPTLTSVTFGAGNALNTYVEQQAFTPTIIGSTSAGTGTYTLQSGWHSKIGNMVFAAIEITWTNHTGTGDLWIGNLPFTVRNSANYSPEGIVNTQNMTLPGGANRTAIGSAAAGTTHLIVVVAVSGGANSPVQMQTSGNIHATIAYLT